MQIVDCDHQLDVSILWVVRHVSCLSFFAPQQAVPKSGQKLFTMFLLSLWTTFFDVHPFFFRSFFVLGKAFQHSANLVSFWNPTRPPSPWFYATDTRVLIQQVAILKTDSFNLLAINSIQIDLFLTTCFFAHFASMHPSFFTERWWQCTSTTNSCLARGTCFHRHFHVLFMIHLPRAREPQAFEIWLHRQPFALATSQALLKSKLARCKGMCVRSAPVPLYLIRLPFSSTKKRFSHLIAQLPHAKPYIRKGRIGAQQSDPLDSGASGLRMMRHHQKKKVSSNA